MVDKNGQPLDTLLQFRRELLEWYKNHQRDFYWRREIESLSRFQVLMTEIFLQRTRADVVDGLMPDLMEVFVTPDAVLEVNRDELIALIKPLGLYERRFQNIQQLCQSLVDNHDGEVPHTREELVNLPGVGEYTADAVLAICDGKPVLMLDANVRFVAERCLGINSDGSREADDKIRNVLEPCVPEEDPAAFNWALIDLGDALRKSGQDCPVDPDSYDATELS
ncbi:endonuclease III domain-containing protein [Halobacteriaceae archaeon GCM10025711]